MRAIGDVLGRSIWKRTTLVLTHGNLSQTPSGTDYGGFNLLLYPVGNHLFNRISFLHRWVCNKADPLLEEGHPGWIPPPPRPASSDC